jgi:hypothetical protein
MATCKKQYGGTADRVVLEEIFNGLLSRVEHYFEV